MMQSKLRVIGITGITGSGASTAAGILKDFGGFVISADCLAHDAIKKGQEAYKKIIETFGESIQMPGGEINRKALGALVFGVENEKSRACLESIIHPVVMAKISELVNDCKNPFAVIDAPLLIESGLHKECDEVWLVTASDEVRVSRLMGRDGIGKTAATKRLSSRQNEENLKIHADLVIVNNEGIPALRKQVSKLIRAYLGTS